MAIFTTTVGNTKKEMISYLKKHFRYDTASSWNCSTSYANKVKMFGLGFTKEQLEKAWEIYMDDEMSRSVYDRIDDLIQGFTADHDYRYTVGFNGRSSGYLVLYHSERKDSGYKSFCPVCGQRNYQAVSEKSHKCGRCGNERIDYSSKCYELVAYPGRSIDQDTDFDDWSLDELSDRVKLVQDFDRLCDDIVDEVKHILDTSSIKEQEEIKTITVTKKVLVTAED